MNSVSWMGNIFKNRKKGEDPTVRRGLYTVLSSGSSKLRGFTLLDDLVLALHPPGITIVGLCFPSQQRRCWPREVRPKSGYSVLRPCSLFSGPGVTGQGPLWPLIFASMREPEPQDLFSNQHLHLHLAAPQAPHFPGLRVLQQADRKQSVFLEKGWSGLDSVEFILIHESKI